VKKIDKKLIQENNLLLYKGLVIITDASPTVLSRPARIARDEGGAPGEATSFKKQYFLSSLYLQN